MKNERKPHFFNLRVSAAIQKYDRKSSEETKILNLLTKSEEIIHVRLNAA